MSVIAGPDRIVAVAAEHPTDLFFHLPAPFVSPTVLDAAAVLFMTSLFAAMLAFHHTVARYTLTLAREGVLPRFLARTRADEVPVGGSIAQSALALVVLIGYVAAGLDPTTDLFFVGTVSGGLGVLLLMAVASIAVLRFFVRRPSGENVWRRIVAPVVSAAFLLPVSLVTVMYFGDMLGSTDPVEVWAAPIAYLTAGTAGLIWGSVLRARSGRPVLGDDGRTAAVLRQPADHAGRH
jgi:amino acid transporter